MIERSDEDLRPEDGWSDDISATDAAAYVYDITGGMATLARDAGLLDVASALEQVRTLAGQKLKRRD